MTEPKPRIGLVGAGGIASAHLPGLRAAAGELRVFSEAYGPAFGKDAGVRRADSLDDLIDWAEIIDVATPSDTHYRIAAQALTAGRHVICEKPLALRVEDAAELVALAERHGVRLFPAHVVRYFPAYAEAKRAVDAGALGPLAVMRFVRSGSFPWQPWFADTRRSGGVVGDLMIHDVDIARWFAGEVVRVSAVRHRLDEGDRPVEAAHVLLTHASGTITQVAGLWGAPDLRFGTEFSVTGTLGALTYSSAAEENYVVDPAHLVTGSNFLPAREADDDDPYTQEITSFVAACLGGPAPRVDAGDGLEAVRIAVAALTSIGTGQPVDLARAE
ncbi:MAG TPA: Gfo/Idh/MocA family oxidoreductase [Propionibacteriaceae bacterium]|nr:Gfo/Idh/MocA family oxidoreductase [Propionibacteriaceae bacterium]